MTTRKHTCATRYTLVQAKEACRRMGLTINKRDGEYRVAYQGNVTDTEPSASYTDDINDAVATGKAMAIRQQLVKCGCAKCQSVMNSMGGANAGVVLV